MCYPEGSEGDNKSFFQGRRRSPEGGSEATSSRDHHCRSRLHRNKRGPSVEC